MVSRKKWRLMDDETNGGAVLPHSTHIRVARQRLPTGLVSRFIESCDSLRCFIGRVCLLLWLLCHCASSFAFTAVYAFGDSLTDTGNRPANATLYFENRFSNGPLWIEYFSEYLGIRYEQSHNLAVSTSTTEKTLAQAQGFSAPENSTDALYIVWAGGNDFLNGLVNGLDLAAWENTVSTAVNNLSNCVEILYSKGARTIIVPNAVDYSQVPGSAFFPSEFREVIRAQVISFNTSLRSMRDIVAEQHGDLTLKVFDVTGLLNELLANPERFGITNTTMSAQQDSLLTDKTFDGPGKDYLFWDLVHPTSKVHAIIAERMAEIVGSQCCFCERV